MKSSMVGGTLLVVIMLLALLAPDARASELHQSTLITFTQPVQIPGNRVLAAGSYLFVLLNSRNDLNTLEIYNANRSVLEAILRTEPAFRETPTYSSQFKLADQGGRHPPALVSWFYPGTDYGHEFVYSPRMQKRLNNDNETFSRH